MAAFHKDVTIVCKDAILPEPLLKNHTVNGLTYDENTRKPYRDNLCFFRAPALHLHRNQRLEEKITGISNLFKRRMDGLSPSQFHGVHMNNIPIVKNRLLLQILLYEINIVEGNIIGELVRWSMQKHEYTVRLLRYNNHIYYVSNINATFQFFCCPHCDTFFKKPFNLGAI